MTKECNYCGATEKYIENGGVCCECGLKFVEVQSYTGYAYGDVNCIDNILEDKRSGRYRHRN